MTSRDLISVGEMGRSYGAMTSRDLILVGEMGRSYGL